MAYPRKNEIDEAIKCVEAITKNVDKIEQANNNGGVEADPEEIAKWERMLVENSEKSRCPSPS